MEKIIELLYPNVEADISSVLNSLGLGKWIVYREIIYYSLVLVISYCAVFLYKKVSKRIGDLKTLYHSRPLSEYYSSEEISEATSNYISTRGQSVDPSKYLELREALKEQNDSENLIQLFHKEFAKRKNSKKFFLVLGDSGMGKTTFMINLYLKFQKKVVNRKRKDIYLIPLSNSNYKKKIEEIDVKNKEAILLLDAFDEDVTAWENPEKNLEDLVQLVTKFSIVILTSRGHFFSSRLDDVTKLNVFENLAGKQNYELHKFFVSPISDHAINLYLIKKYWTLPARYFRAKKIVKRCPNLVVRPMILANIDYLIKEKKDYYFSAEIYLVLILSWIKRERKFIDEASIISFSKQVAMDMYTHRNDRKGLFINEQQLKTFLITSGIDIDSVILKTRSLLNRTKDRYKFSHKSILEYFLASNYFDIINLTSIHLNNFDNPFYLDGLSDANRFFEEIFIIKVATPYVNSFSNITYSPKQLYLSKILNLEGTRIPSLDVLRGFDQLEVINLRRTLVRNLVPLYRLSNLKELKLKGTYYDPSFGNVDSILELEELKARMPKLKIDFN